MNTATSHSPIIHAYISIRPHHPLPSVIRRSIPMRRPAASIPVTFLSKPCTARSTTDFSDSRLDWKDCEEVFNCEARERREVVSVSCSARDCERADSAAWVLVVSVEVGAGVGADGVFVR